MEKTDRIFMEQLKDSKTLDEMILVLKDWLRDAKRRKKGEVTK